MSVIASRERVDLAANTRGIYPADNYL